mgnify:CR=1 FL=1
MNETEYRLRLKGEIDIEAVIAATSESDAIDKADAIQEAIIIKLRLIAAISPM